MVRTPSQYGVVPLLVVYYQCLLYRPRLFRQFQQWLRLPATISPAPITFGRCVADSDWGFGHFFIWLFGGRCAFRRIGSGAGGKECRCGFSRTIRVMRRAYWCLRAPEGAPTRVGACSVVGADLCAQWGCCGFFGCCAPKGAPTGVRGRWGDVGADLSAQ
jgi:hypothetical protein